MPQATGINDPFPYNQNPGASVGIIDSVEPYTPATAEFNEANSVENRAAGIIEQDGPLMQLAETKGKQQANSKGILNTTMGIDAAQKSVLDKSVEIAGQDSQQFHQSDQFNANQENAFGMQELQGDQSLEQIEARGIIDSNLSDDQRTFEAGENLLSRNLETETQVREAATELMRQISGQNATLTDALGRIMASDMTQENKNSMVDQLTTMHYNNLNTTSAMADYSVVDGKVVYNGGGVASGGGDGSATGQVSASTPAPSASQAPSQSSPAYATPDLPFNPNNTKDALAWVKENNPSAYI